MRSLMIGVLALCLSSVVPVHARGSLMQAVDNENERKVRGLIASGADVDACYEKFPYSALNEAVGYSPDLYVELLLDAGADPEKICSRLSPLELAAQKGYLETMKMLLDAGGDPNFASALDGSLLHESIEDANVAKLVALLIEAGADVSATTGAGATTLMWAASKASAAEVVRELLKAGADRCAIDDDGLTVMDYLDRRSYSDDDRSSGLEGQIRAQLRGANGEFANCARVAAQEKQQERLLKTWERDLALPVAVRHDKYMVALTSHLKQEHYTLALGYFDMLERLDVLLAASFDFYYGEALLRTGQAEKAIDKLYAYIKAEGAEGDHYGRALELVNEAEAL